MFIFIDQKLILVVISMILINFVESSELNRKEKYIFESKYPVDTLLTKKNLNFQQRIALVGIRMWQQKSYNQPKLNCQFYPSCSNFCAKKIVDNNFTVGLVMGIDRFIRCNESAYKNYKAHQDYLSDNFIIDHSILTKNKIPILGLSLCIIPGMGRVYYGQYKDGINSFKYTFPLILSSVLLSQNNYDLSSFLFGSIALLFWTSDFYGTYNLIKSYSDY